MHAHLVWAFRCGERVLGVVGRNTAVCYEVSRTIADRGEGACMECLGPPFILVNIHVLCRLRTPPAHVCVDHCRGGDELEAVAGSKPESQSAQ